jgi:16S rRNA (guanine1207-N2)-methyltransferase
VDPTPTADHRDGAEHYFAGDPAVRSAPSEVPLVLPDLRVALVTDRGVFSRDRVDTGTRLLLLEGPLPPAGAVDLLDLGCGYGPIAVTLAHRAPHATVWATDVNSRARACTAENARRLGLTNLRVAAPDDVPDEVRFDAIWSNPPVRIGKPALHALLAAWLDRLAAGGHAHLVVQKHLGADSLQRWLVDQGWPTERTRARAGYRLLDVRAREAR